MISEQQSDVDENEEQQNDEEEDQSYASRMEQNSVSEHSVVI